MSAIVGIFSSSLQLSEGCSDHRWFSRDNGNAGFFRKQHWFNTGCWTSSEAFFLLLLILGFLVPSIWALDFLPSQSPLLVQGIWPIPPDTPMAVWDTAVVTAPMNKWRVHVTFWFGIQLTGAAFTLLTSASHRAVLQTHHCLGECTVLLSAGY